MKKKTARILSILLSVLLTASLLGACASASDNSPGGGGSGGVTEITYAFWGDENELATVTGVIEQFHAEQNEIRVTPMCFDRAEYTATLNTFAAGGNLPDSAFMAEDMVIMWAEQGLLADASTMYNEGGSSPLDSVAFKWQGKTLCHSSANEVLLLFFNKDKFTAAGVTPPPMNADNAWDWDTFVDIAKQMTFDANGNNAKSPDFDKNNIKEYGVMLNPDLWQLEVWTRMNGSGFYDKDGNVTIDNPAAIEALQRVADLHLVHNVMPQYGTNMTTLIDTDLLNNCAMYVSGQWSVGVWLGPARDSDGLNYGIGVLPYMKEKVTINTAGVTVVFSQGKKQDAAMKWLKWYANNSWGLVEAGIWMPNLEIYYKDEAYTRKWVENPNFPPYEEYKSAVVDYTVKYAKPTSWYWVNNTNLFNDALSSILSPVWSGNDTVENAIKSNIDALKAANKGQ